MIIWTMTDNNDGSWNRGIGRCDNPPIPGSSTPIARGFGTFSHQPFLGTKASRLWVLMEFCGLILLWVLAAKMFQPAGEFSSDSSNSFDHLKFCEIKTASSGRQLQPKGQSMLQNDPPKGSHGLFSACSVYRKLWQWTAVGDGDSSPWEPGHVSSAPAASWRHSFAKVSESFLSCPHHSPRVPHPNPPIFTSKSTSGA